MSWNDSNDNERDPWGGRRGDQGPPDLDEVVRKMQEKLSGVFGRGGRGGGPRGVAGGGRDPNTKAVWTIVGLALLALLIFLSFYRIGPAERGLVLRFGKYQTTLQPGPHLRFPPPIEQVIKVNIDQIRAFTVNASMLTQDENIVDVEMAVQYRINEVEDYVLKISDPDESVHRAAESSIREIIGTNEFDFVITEGRADIAVKAKDLMQQMLDTYHSGIEVTSVNMAPATPPEQVKAAFDDAIKAREDEQRKVNEAEAYRNEIIERSQGEAARMRLEAEAYREQVVARSEGEARRFEKLLAEYERAPEVTRRRLYIETVENVLSNSSKVMLDAQGGNSLMYLPLDKLMQKSRSRSAIRGDHEPDFLQEEYFQPSPDPIERSRTSSRTRGSR